MGVGQSEVDIVKTADTIVMVMVPGLGDDIQSIKAGIMEIGDIFAINKSDLFGSDRTATEVNMMLDLSMNMERRPPVVKVTASKNQGVDDLISEMKKHADYLKTSGRLEERRRNNLKLEVVELIESELKKIVISRTTSENRLEWEVNKILNKEKNIYEVRDEFLKEIKK